MEILSRKTALIAVHVQGDIISKEGAFAPFFFEEVQRRNVVKKLRDLVDVAHQAGIHVIYTKVAFSPDYSDLIPNAPLLQVVQQGGSLKEGNVLTEIIEPLAPRPEDTVATHTTVGGLTPELLSLLSERGIDTLLIAGVATNVSVEGTARAAVDLGYNVVIVEDACSAANPDAHQASLASLSLLAAITTVDEVRSASLTQQPA